MQVFTKRLLPVLLLFLSISVLAQNKTYYVSSSGNDSNSGTSASNAWRSIGKVNSANLASGDKVLFKRGNRWDEQLKITKSGASGNSIIFGAYGSGAKPILSASSGSYTVTITDRSYITIKDIHVIAPPTAGGISIRGNATNVEIRDCKVEGNSSNRSYTGIVYSVAYQGRYPSRIRIINNDVSRFFQGLLGQDGMKGGGFIEGNRIHSFRPGGEDGIVAKRGNFEGLVIRDNEVTGWLDDGIDLYGGNNVIVEYNRVHDVSRTLNGGGNGIKGGGADAKSDNNIIRYNKVYNIVASSSGVKAGISTNAGDNMKIYGNLVYNVQGEAITVTGGSQNISVYHNTAISTGKQALYISGSAANVSLRNNIFWGIRGDINVNLPTSGRNNLFINGPGGKYSGSNDIKASASEVFASVSNRDYRLKSGSPAIDKGISISGYTSSIDKKSIEGTPDIGAYEYGGSSSPPPTEPKPEPEPAPTPPTDPEPEPESPTGNNGLQYRYYEGSWSTLPNFAGQSVRKQGNVANFNVGVRQREDNFGIVFTGSIQINSGGTYTFYTNSDDGSRLYIDGKQVVNNDGLHAPRERSGSISLSSGRHKIEVQFFERTIGQVLDVRYAGPGVSKRAIPNGVLFPDGGSTNPTPPTDPEPEPESPTGNNGLQYRYYEGSWSTLPNFAGQSVRKQGNVANFNVGVRQREDNFGIVFTGSIQINSGGNYTFYTNSDDGSKLYIDGKQVVDNDGLHAPRERSGSISLSSGRHKIEVQFFERTIGQVLDVRYAGPGVSKRAIPNGVLFPTAAALILLLLPTLILLQDKMACATSTMRGVGVNCPTLVACQSLRAVHSLTLVCLRLVPTATSVLYTPGILKWTRVAATRFTLHPTTVASYTSTTNRS